MNLRLTADEKELLGLEVIYSVTRDMDGSYHFKITESSNIPVLPYLPYEYVRRVGAFQIMNLNDSLSNKVGKLEVMLFHRLRNILRKPLKFLSVLLNSFSIFVIILK